MQTKLLLLFLVFSTLTLHASKDDKIERKLARLFEKSKFDKCRTKALKLKKKNPGSDIPVLYLSKIALQQYAISDKDVLKFKYIKQSTRYSKLLSSDKDSWTLTVRDSLLSFINNTHNPEDTIGICKSAIKFYTKNFNDTIPLYGYYYGSGTHTINNPMVFSSYSDSIRYKLITVAETLNGIKYSYAGETPETGFDCSGFTKYVYGQIGVDLPHNAHKQSLLDGNNKTLAEAKPGDLIFFGYSYDNRHNTAHTGIIYAVTDDGITVVHCVSGGVSIEGKDSSWDRYWKDRVLFVKSLVD